MARAYIMASSGGNSFSAEISSELQTAIWDSELYKGNLIITQRSKRLRGQDHLRNYFKYLNIELVDFARLSRTT